MPSALCSVTLAGVLAFSALRVIPCPPSERERRKNLKQRKPSLINVKQVVQGPVSLASLVSDAAPTMDCSQAFSFIGHPKPDLDHSRCFLSLQATSERATHHSQSSIFASFLSFLVFLLSPSTSRSFLADCTSSADRQRVT